MLDAFSYLLCPKLCRHNRRKPNGEAWSDIDIRHSSIKLFNDDIALYKEIRLSPHDQELLQEDLMRIREAESLKGFAASTLHPYAVIL